MFYVRLSHWGLNSNRLVKFIHCVGRLPVYCPSHTGLHFFLTIGTILKTAPIYQQVFEQIYIVPR